jgi:hypothetical protein
MTLDSCDDGLVQVTATDAGKMRYLVHGIGILQIQILHDNRNLPLQFQLVPLLEIQTRSVDYGQENPVESGFAYLDARAIDSLRSFCTFLQEFVHGLSLVRIGGWGYVGSVHDKSK